MDEFVKTQQPTGLGGEQTLVDKYLHGTSRMADVQGTPGKRNVEYIKQQVTSDDLRARFAGAEPGRRSRLHEASAPEILKMTGRELRMELLGMAADVMEQGPEAVDDLARLFVGLPLAESGSGAVGEDRSSARQLASRMEEATNLLVAERREEVAFLAGCQSADSLRAVVDMQSFNMSDVEKHVGAGSSIHSAAVDYLTMPAKAILDPTYEPSSTEAQRYLMAKHMLESRYAGWAAISPSGIIEPKPMSVFWDTSKSQFTFEELYADSVMHEAQHYMQLDAGYFVEHGVPYAERPQERIAMYMGLSYVQHLDERPQSLWRTIGPSVLQADSSFGAEELARYAEQYGNVFGMAALDPSKAISFEDSSDAFVAPSFAGVVEQSGMLLGNYYDDIAKQIGMSDGHRFVFRHDYLGGMSPLVQGVSDGAITTITFDPWLLAQEASGRTDLADMWMIDMPATYGVHFVQRMAEEMHFQYVGKGDKNQRAVSQHWAENYITELMRRRYGETWVGPLDTAKSRLPGGGSDGGKLASRGLAGSNRPGVEVDLAILPATALAGKQSRVESAGSYSDARERRTWLKRGGKVFVGPASAVDETEETIAQEEPPPPPPPDVVADSLPDGGRTLALGNIAHGLSRHISSPLARVAGWWQRGERSRRVLWEMRALLGPATSDLNALTSDRLGEMSSGEARRAFFGLGFKGVVEHLRLARAGRLEESSFSRFFAAAQELAQSVVGEMSAETADILGLEIEPKVSFEWLSRKFNLLGLASMGSEEVFLYPFSHLISDTARYTLKRSYVTTLAHEFVHKLQDQWKIPAPEANLEYMDRPRERVAHYLGERYTQWLFDEDRGYRLFDKAIGTPLSLSALGGSEAWQMDRMTMRDALGLTFGWLKAEDSLPVSIKEGVMARGQLPSEMHEMAEGIVGAYYEDIAAELDLDVDAVSGFRHATLAATGASWRVVDEDGRRIIELDLPAILHQAAGRDDLAEAWKSDLPSVYGMQVVQNVAAAMHRVRFGPSDYTVRGPNEPIDLDATDLVDPLLSDAWAGEYTGRKLKEGQAEVRRLMEEQRLRALSVDSDEQQAPADRLESSDASRVLTEQIPADTNRYLDDSVGPGSQLLTPQVIGKDIFSAVLSLALGKVQREAFGAVMGTIASVGADPGDQIVGDAVAGNVVRPQQPAAMLEMRDEGYQRRRAMLLEKQMQDSRTYNQGMGSTAVNQAPMRANVNLNVRGDPDDIPKHKFDEKLAAIINGQR